MRPLPCRMQNFSMHGAMTAWPWTGAARRLALLLLTMLLAACGCLTRQAPLAGIAPAPPAPVHPARSEPAQTAAPGTAEVPALPVDAASAGAALPDLPLPLTEPEAQAAVPDAQAPVAIAEATPAAGAPVRAPGSQVALAPVRSSPAPAPVARAPEPALDVTALKLRLRETDGIGLFDKLVLKRELDNLLDRFRSEHESGQRSGLARLRNPYDSLVQKVLGALRQRDPDLARLILASREALWAILSDPAKFYSIN
jgi:hypothetical protein